MAEKETTEETTGGKYLTKSYLVRNLQNFWNRIKKYIADQKFVNEDTVKGALLLKADQSGLESLTDNVNGKASASDLESLKTTVNDKVSQRELTERLAGKVDAVEGQGLSTNDFTTEYRNKLDGLEDATTETSGLMSAADKAKLEGIERGANKISVEATLKSNSANPVQCRAINAALAKKVDKIEELFIINMALGNVNAGKLAVFGFKGGHFRCVERG